MTLTETDLSLLTVQEAAELVGVAPGTIHQWIARYGLTWHPSGGGQRFLSERDVLECDRARRRRGKQRAWRTG